jgi:hypothetical protein
MEIFARHPIYSQLYIHPRLSLTAEGISTIDAYLSAFTIFCLPNCSVGLNYLISPGRLIGAWQPRLLVLEGNVKHRLCEHLDHADEQIDPEATRWHERDMI